MGLEKRLAVGIITCMRPKGLQKILGSIAAQEVPAGYSVKAIVVDNDLTGKNQEIVQQVERKTGLPIIFVEEPIRGIPAARNASVQTALDHDFDAMIFIDDDEIAPGGWLRALIKLWEESNADVVTGPVIGVLPKNSPIWALNSGIYNMTPKYREGEKMNVAYTSNTLVTKKLLQDLGTAFSMKFRYTGGSDFHYFKLAYIKGYVIVWCPDAFVYEEVPSSRIKISWQLKRGYRSGASYSIAIRELENDLKSTISCVLFGLSRIGFGLVQIFLSPVGGWKYLMLGLKRIAFGTGCLFGLLGFNYLEYRTIHGS